MKYLLKIAVYIMLFISIDNICRAQESNTQISTDCPQSFVRIFNGVNLSQWEGDERFWSVKDGIIVGQVGLGVRVRDHSYLIWQGGSVKDFELHAKFRWGSGNGGIDYRAERIEKDNKGRELKWTIEGYQADISPTKGWMCSLYNWNKQGAQPGQFVVVDEGQKSAGHISKVANKEDLVEGVYKPDQWNDVVIIVRGSHIIQRLNGYLTTELIDNGLLSRKQGLVGMQIHNGLGPAKFEFKDICIKHYDVSFEKAKLLFNGSDLSGWNLSSKKTPSPWNVENGCIIDKGNSGSYIATDEEYTSYVLRFQYHQRSKGEIALLLQMPDSKPKSQLNCIKVHGIDGDLNQIEAYKKRPSELSVQSSDITSFKQLPESFWNDCEITLNKEEIEVKVNNVVRVSAKGIKNVPGLIGFESGNGRTEYRNIVLIPILE